MKAAIVNPYLDTLGGGERYSLAVATSLSELGYQVDVEWKNPKIKKALEERFGIDLANINFIPDTKKGDGYDVCFWVSDGSIPLLKARTNLLHFQVPFKGVNGRTLFNKMKLFRVDKIICNSYFTKKVIDKEFGVRSVVINPPVAVEKIKSKRKTDSILFVGRFSQLTQSKNQHVLVRNFKKLEKSFPSWELILAGGSEIGAYEYVKKLEKGVSGFQIKIIQSPGFSTLLTLYGQAKIFWSAAGFGIKEDKEPEKTEHFGISLVEAMAAGAVPIAFRAGGHKEIIKEGENGFLWEKERELVLKTKLLIQDRKLLARMQASGRASAQKYNYGRFKKEIEKIL